mmetsp:Transcript_41638/g.110499  ORF Transcript_41638/g.110499 Transcript_41638/m.110499 type:complete len:546 (+) Transcript_41638:481-2118(+)
MVPQLVVFLLEDHAVLCQARVLQEPLGACHDVLGVVVRLQRAVQAAARRGQRRAALQAAGTLLCRLWAARQPRRGGRAARALRLRAHCRPGGGGYLRKGPGLHQRRLPLLAHALARGPRSPRAGFARLRGLPLLGRLVHQAVAARASGGGGRQRRLGSKAQVRHPGAELRGRGGLATPVFGICLLVVPLLASVRLAAATAPTAAQSPAPVVKGARHPPRHAPGPLEQRVPVQREGRCSLIRGLERRPQQLVGGAGRSWARRAGAGAPLRVPVCDVSGSRGARGTARSTGPLSAGHGVPSLRGRRQRGRTNRCAGPPCLRRRRGGSAQGASVPRGRRHFGRGRHLNAGRQVFTLCGQRWLCRHVRSRPATFADLCAGPVGMRSCRTTARMPGLRGRRQRDRTSRSAGPPGLHSCCGGSAGVAHVPLGRRSLDSCRQVTHRGPGLREWLWRGRPLRSTGKSGLRSRRRGSPPIGRVPVDRRRGGQCACGIAGRRRCLPDARSQRAEEPAYHQRAQRESAAHRRHPVWPCPSPRARGRGRPGQHKWAA